MKYIVLGGRGRLGKEIEKIRPNWIYYGSTEADILGAPWDLINEQELPVLNLAAYTNTRLAETERDQCYLNNVIGPKNLCRYVEQPIVHVSSDFVFLGDGPKIVGDPVNPTGYYGLTKALSEEIVLASGGTVLRLSHKPRMISYDMIQKNYYTSADYTDHMASLLVSFLESKMYPELYHLGMPSRSLSELYPQLPTYMGTLKDYSFLDCWMPHLGVTRANP